MAYRQQIGASGPLGGSGAASLGGGGGDIYDDPSSDTREEMRRLQTENVRYYHSFLEDKVTFDVKLDDNLTLSLANSNPGSQYSF